MAKCRLCHREILTAKTCTFKYLVRDLPDGSEEYIKRNSTHFDYGDRCHDCGIDNVKGNYHHENCDIERCPVCKGQLLSCGCDLPRWAKVKPRHG